LQEPYQGLLNHSRHGPQAAPRAQPHYYTNQYYDYEDDDNGFYYDDDDDDDDEDDAREFFEAFFGGFGSGHGRYQGYDDMEQTFREWKNREREQRKDREAMIRAHVADMKARQAERDAAGARQTAQKQAQKDAAHAATQQLRTDNQRVEQAKQNERWTAEGCVTKDEKLPACCHSDYCVKVKQQKPGKLKCSACRKKGGMLAFECSYCSSFLCQQCVASFSQRRAKLDSVKPVRESAPLPHTTSTPIAENDRVSDSDPSTEPGQEDLGTLDRRTDPEPTQELAEPGINSRRTQQYTNPTKSASLRPGLGADPNKTNGAYHNPDLAPSMEPSSGSGKGT
jgi:hypothetical protein